MGSRRPCHILLLSLSNVLLFISGRDHNPSWDHSEPRNVHALVAIFGYHLLFDLAFLVMGYLATAMALRWRQHDRVEFKPLINDDSDSEETLLSKV